MSKLKIISTILIMTILLEIILPIISINEVKADSSDKIQITLSSTATEIKKGVNGDNFIDVDFSCNLSKNQGIDELFATVFYDKNILEYIDMDVENNFRNSNNNNNYPGEIELSFERDSKFGQDSGLIAKFKFKVLKDAPSTKVRIGNIDENGNIDSSGVEIECAYNGTLYSCDPQLLEIVTKSALTVNPNGGKWRDSSNKVKISKNEGSTENIEEPSADGYNVVFNANGGNSEKSSINTNRKFTSWTGSGSNYLVENTYTFPNNDMELIANYEDEEIVLPNATREGYIFEGWYTDSESGTFVGKAGDKYLASQNITLFAKWLGKSNLKVDPNGEEWNNSKDVQTFTQNDGTTIKINDPKIISKPEKINFNVNGGKEEIDSKEFNRVFDKWTGSGLKNLSNGIYSFKNTNSEELIAEYKIEEVKLPSVEKDGYIFLGWYDKETEGTKVGNAGDNYITDGYVFNPGKETTLYAYWQKEDDETFKITYLNTKDVNNSKNPTAYTKNSEKITLANLKDTDEYKFEGWYDKDNNKVTEIDTSAGGDIELYAKWEEIKKTVEEKVEPKVTQDTTRSTIIIPKTGKRGLMIISLIAMIMFIYVNYKKYKKYSDIK